EVEAEGTTEGELVAAPRGDGGFGWDPVFLPNGESRTYGEMSPADKDRLSHRARAWRAFVTRLGQEQTG
ncbi:MAG: non-canonical purine NTP pyrophosphatase, partial [Thermoanaerobaculia bacterium]